eukprot:5127842-Prorocentrum_lima.AAC.1
MEEVLSPKAEQGSIQEPPQEDSEHLVYQGLQVCSGAPVVTQASSKWAVEPDVSGGAPAASLTE